MKKKGKISLRLHIFLAFFLVLAVSFSIIFAVFNVLTKVYINDAAQKAIRRTYEMVASAYEQYDNSIFPIVESRSPFEIVLEEIVEKTLRNRADDAMALVLTSADFSLLWPSENSENSWTISTREITRAREIVTHIRTGEQDIRSEDTQIFFLQSENTFYYILPLTIDRQLAFHLLITYDISGYDAFFSTINHFLLVIMFGTTALSVIITLVISRSIISSIKKLSRFADNIGRGKYEAQEFSFIDKEIDKLASNMNTMAVQIDHANQERQIFFQNASHELRTPLMSIQGYAEGIKYKIFDDPEAASEIIISESGRLSEMVENLLSISRMDMALMGKQIIPKNSIDIRELTSSVIEKMQGYALRENKKIDISFPEEEVSILGNENDLFRAIQNVLSNCIRYATGKIRVEIQKTASQTAKIQISDDGPGIDTELLPRIFERFSKGAGGKHGIGLALAKAIVTEHAGTISAENNTDGNGAVFAVELPLLPD